MRFAHEYWRSHHRTEIEKGSVGLIIHFVVRVGSFVSQNILMQKMIIAFEPPVLYGMILFALAPSINICDKEGHILFGMLVRLVLKGVSAFEIVFLGIRVLKIIVGFIAVPC